MAPSLTWKAQDEHSRRDGRLAETEGINKSGQKKLRGEQVASRKHSIYLRRNQQVPFAARSIRSIETQTESSLERSHGTWVIRCGGCYSTRIVASKSRTHLHDTESEDSDMPRKCAVRSCADENDCGL